MATLIQYLQEVLLSGDPTLPNETKRILLKEALQVIVLDYLYNHPRYRGLRFYGGSCLRVVYGLNRLSEDLDLDNQLKIDLGRLNEDLSGYFSQRLNYSDITTKEQTGRTGILRLTLKFTILQALALSPLQEEALHLKLEISHHPQIAEEACPRWKAALHYKISHAGDPGTGRPDPSPRSGNRFAVAFRAARFHRKLDRFFLR
jgi:hypothetical protein